MSFLDGHSKRKAGNTSKLQIILLVLCTNLVSVFLFSGPFHWIPRQYLHPDYDFNHSSTPATANAHDPPDPWMNWGRAGAMPAELREFMAPQKLPLGNSKSMGIDTMYPSVGQACAMFKHDLDHYMAYERGELCPEDESLAQKLILKGCEPLPRRRCIARSSPNYQEPYPFPQCMWTTPPNSSVFWTAYTCKDYACLIDRKNHPGFDDCKDCFDLQHREKSRWLKTGGSLDYSIDEVLNLKKGTIRIGLDIGGGTATFAVRMRERNVTIVTTSMNFNGPFNNFIASRGVVPLYMTINQRLPFFDNTLDIVHSMHVLSNWIPTQTLEFMVYDIYRVLRARWGFLAGSFLLFGGSAGDVCAHD